MARYLIVAHQTAASNALISRLEDIAAADSEARFVLLVPATNPGHMLTWVEGEREEIARRRAEEAEVELKRAGLSLSNVIVGPSDPLQAIKEELLAGPQLYASVIISTLPIGISRWLRRDLPGQVRKLGVDVIHVVSEAAPPETKRPATVPNTATGIEVPSGPTLTLQGLALWFGKPLYARDGVLGDLHEILYEYVSGEPVWLGVASRPLPFRTLLVPARSARVVDNRLVASQTKERALAQPHVDVGEGFASLSEEEHIYRYFGLPFDELRDIRVLREGQPLPGTQRNWQSILDAESAPTRR